MSAASHPSDTAPRSSALRGARNSVQCPSRMRGSSASEPVDCRGVIFWRQNEIPEERNKQSDHMLPIFLTLQVHRQIKLLHREGHKREERSIATIARDILLQLRKRCWI